MLHRIDLLLKNVIYSFVTVDCTKHYVILLKYVTL